MVVANAENRMASSGGYSPTVIDYLFFYLHYAVWLNALYLLLVCGTNLN